MGQPLLEIAGLTVLRDGVPVLRDLSFAVAAGTIHAVIGPNGGGKSTLLSAILGRLEFSGNIRIHARQGGRIGYVPQAIELERSLPLTAAELLALTRQRRPICLGLSRGGRTVASRLLQSVGLAGFENRPLRGLSGGELQRLLLANASDPTPELLILDEPSSALDAGAAAYLEEHLAALRARKTTTLLVSHDLAQVERLADRVTILHQTVLFDGRTQEALERVSWAPRYSPDGPRDRQGQHRGDARREGGR